MSLVGVAIHKDFRQHHYLHISSTIRSYRANIHIIYFAFSKFTRLFALNDMRQAKGLAKGAFFHFQILKMTSS